MSFSFDGEPRVEHRRCKECGDGHDLARGLVLRDGGAYASYFAYWYPHQNEAWLDVTLGTWKEPDYPDNVTFGCRIWRGEMGHACGFVEAGRTLSDNRVYGRKLSPDEARIHPWRDSFWEVVDWLIPNDPTLHEHVHHLPTLN